MKMTKKGALDKDETLKKKSTHGGAREGAGRPKGKMNKETKERILIEREFRNKVMRSANRLFIAQMLLAEGVSYLWRIDKDEDGKKQKPVLVTSPDEIEEYLADDIDRDSYYFISTDKPDNRAIDSLMNRTFGMPKQSIELEDNRKFDEDEIDERLRAAGYDPDKIVAPGEDTSQKDS